MTVAATAPKKRTRKAAPKKPVVKVTQVKAGKAPTRSLKTVKRPSSTKLITPQRYWSDIKTRWAIHNYEITLLVSDLTKGFNFVRDLSRQLVK